jgi:hypothetical protein
MGRNRKANLEFEYALERQVKDLKEENAKLKKLLREKEKTGKVEKVETPKIKKSVEKECPSCGANVKVSLLPMGSLELCGAACGYRAVIKNKKED